VADETADFERRKGIEVCSNIGRLPLHLGVQGGRILVRAGDVGDAREDEAERVLKVFALELPDPVHEDVGRAQGSADQRRGRVGGELRPLLGVADDARQRPHERFEEAANELKAYLSQTDDQGNAYGKLAQALERLGRVEEAREAYQQGIIAANRHGHPGMAQDFEMALDDLI